MADVEQTRTGSNERPTNKTGVNKDIKESKTDTVQNGKKKSVQINVKIKTDSQKLTGNVTKSGSTEKPVSANNDTKGREENKKSEGQGQRSPLQRSKTTLGYIKEPTFVITASNGAGLVESALSDLGWKRINDKQFENFKLKWVECKSAINYSSFKEGEQLVNRIPNCSLLTNKMGLLGSLQAYERVCGGMKKGPKLKLNDFVPETYRVDDPKEKQAFLDTYKEGEIWICKPTGMNQGKGIYLVRDLESLNKNLQERDEKQKMHKRTMGRIIQRYIHNPLLLEGRKFDIRAYMLIASTTPYLVLYHKGYVRLSMVKYENDTSNLIAHLTNQYIQKKDPNYKDAKETTAWSMDRFNDYINENFAEDKGIEKDWVYSTFTTKMKQIMTHCFLAVKHKLQCKTGYFDLYGFDFMIDENMKIWLIEVNVNPALAINCEALKEVIPGVIKETVNIAIECFEKSKRNQPLMPLKSLQNFTILHNGGGGVRPGQSSSPPRSYANNSENINSFGMLRSKSLSPIRRSRSLSPVKEVQNTDSSEAVKPLTRKTAKETQYSKEEQNSDSSSSDQEKPQEKPLINRKSPKESPNTDYNIPAKPTITHNTKGVYHGSTNSEIKESVKPTAPKSSQPKVSPKATRHTVSAVTPIYRPAPIHPNLERSPYNISIATADPIKLKMTHANSASGKGSKKNGKADRSDRGN